MPLTLNYLQLVCCGVSGFSDWISQNQTVPESCCVDMATCDQVNITTSQYNMGCSNSVAALIQSQLVIVAAVGIGFLVAEVQNMTLIHIVTT